MRILFISDIHGVDTPEDAVRIEAILRERQQQV